MTSRNNNLNSEAQTNLHKNNENNHENNEDLNENRDGKDHKQVQ